MRAAPNHKVLVNHCYPKSLVSAAPAYAPVSNDLGKLLYYCSTKQDKAIKVLHVIARRIEHDGPLAAKSPKGKASLCISLSILHKILQGCDSISPFAADTLRVVISALNCNGADLDVVERAASIFSAFASRLDAPVATVDSQLASQYIKVLGMFCKIAIQPYAQNPSKECDLRMLALRAIQSAIASDLFTTTQTGSQVELVVGAVLGNLTEPGVASLDTLRAEAPLLDLDQEGTVTSRLGALKTAPSFRSGYAGESEKREMTGLVLVESLRTLRTLLRTSQATQNKLIGTSACNWADQKTASKEAPQRAWENSEWCCWLAETAVRWTQLQYRFAFISTLVDRLAHLDDAHVASVQQTTLLAMITTVFTSQISLLGLDTTEILVQLMDLIQRRAAHGFDDPLLPPLIRCVSALGTHNYYPDQLSDLVQDVVGFINRPIHQALPLEHRSAVIRATLLCLVGLLDQAQAATPSTRIPLRPFVLEEVLYLWTDPSDPLIRFTFTHALIKIISHDTDQNLQNSSATHFLDTLHATAYSLALGRKVSSGKTPRSTVSDQSDESSHSSHEGSPSHYQPLAVDYTGLKQIMILLHSRSSAWATLSAVPMLFKLDADAARQWTEPPDLARRQACQEVVVKVLDAILAAWAAPVEMGTGQTGTILPLLPPLESTEEVNEPFVAPQEGLPPLTSPQQVVHGLSSSKQLQDATKQDAPLLEATLQIDWTSRKALKHRLQLPPLRRASVVSHRASSVRLDPASSTRSLRNPSIADLRASLIANSIPVSAASSVHSHEGEGRSVRGSPTRANRRSSSRKPTPEQLAFLGIQLGRKEPSRRSSLSKPPIVVG